MRKPSDLTSGDLPVPEIQPMWRYFFDACRDHRLVVEKCASCDSLQFYPRGQCMACGGETGWLDCTGRGTIHSYTLVRATRDAQFIGLVPYYVIVVEIDEGVRMVGNLIADPEDGVRIGARVGAVFGELGNASGIWAPSWKLLP